MLVQPANHVKQQKTLIVDLTKDHDAELQSIKKQKIYAFEASIDLLSSINQALCTVHM